MGSMSLKCFQVLLLVLSIGFVVAYHDPAFQSGLELLQYGCTPDQIYRWWYKTRAKEFNYPRTFPICYDLGLPLPPPVADFQQAFKDLIDVTYYDPWIHGWERGTSSSVFRDMEFSRMSIKKKKPDSKIFNGDEGKNDYHLAQWVDFEVFFHSGIQGLYVQPVAGPLGIPQGEFTLDFNCTDGNKDPKDNMERSSVVPCHFAPRAAHTWPNVYVFDARKKPSTKEVKRVAFRYRWTETHCHETGFFQFIMIATEDFAIFQAILSPIFRYANLDQLSAVPSPYHSYYDYIHCFLDSAHPHYLNIEKIDDGTRIVPSKPYDDCVLYGTGKGTQDTIRNTCPPGYFGCSSYWKTKSEWKAQIDEWWQETVIAPEKDCCEIMRPLGPPPTTTTTTTPPTTTTTPSTTTAPSSSSSSSSSSSTSSPTTTTSFTTLPTTKTPKPSELPLSILHETILKNRTIRYDTQVRITHGDFCTLVWLIMIPLANIAARFFKEYPEIAGCGLGFWIISHGGLHILGLILVWWSFGLVAGTGDNKLGNVSGIHLFLGLTISIIQHASFVTGLRRTGQERKTFNFVLNHSIFGHFSQFAAYLCFFLSNASSPRKYAGLGMFICWAIGVVTLHFVEQRQDRKLGVVLHRAQCPVLQRIVLADGRTPPMSKTKIAIFSVITITHLTIFLVVVSVFTAHYESTTKDNNIFLIK